MSDLTDYSALEDEIKNVPDPVILKKGEEVEARVIAVKTGISDKNECRWYQLVFEVPSNPLVTEFNDFFWDLDKFKLDEKKYIRAVRKFKEFAQAFGIDYTRPFSWEDDLIGLTGWVIVGVKKSDEYGNQNSVQKYTARR